MEITVGIPAYNCHDTIEQTILSIIHQSLPNNLINIIIADDKSKKNYNEIVKKYKSLVNIKEINLKENVGPGFARQKIIDICETEFITFIDADDVFIDYFFLETSIHLFKENPNLIMYRSRFIEELQNKSFVTQHVMHNWMFGKVYKVSKLKEKGIKFTLSRSHEDIEFNKKIELTKDTDELIYYDDQVTYLWGFKKDSITRKNNSEYTYNKGPIGAIKAAIISNEFAINFNKNNFSKNMKEEIFNNLFYMYETYQELLNYRKNTIPKIMDDYKYYYTNIVKNKWENLSEKEKLEYYNNYIFSDYNKKNIVPFITINDFIKLLKGQE